MVLWTGSGADPIQQASNYVLHGHTIFRRNSGAITAWSSEVLLKVTAEPVSSAFEFGSDGTIYVRMSTIGGNLYRHTARILDTQLLPGA